MHNLVNRFGKFRVRNGLSIMYFLVVFYVSMQLPATVNSQNLPINLRFGKYTTDNGLSDNIVYDILKDKNGFLWIATQNGINRFDGVEFKTFVKNKKDSNSLVNNFVNSIAEDSLGRIWAATAGGLSVYNPVTGKFRQFIPPVSRYEKNRVYKVVRAKDGSIWFSTRKHINTIDLATLRVSSWALDSIMGGLHGNTIDIFFEDHNGDFWFDNTNGLSLFSRRTKQAKIMDKTWGLSAFYDDGKGECWMGCWFHGLRNYSFSTKNFTDYLFEKKSDSVTTRDIVSIEHISTPELNSYLWIGDDNELAVFNLNTKSFERYYHYQPDLPTSLPPGMVNKVFFDDRNEIWLGTERGFYNAQLNQLSFQTFIFPDLMTSQVSRVIEDKRDHSYLWIALFPGGLFKMNKKSGLITQKIIPEKKMLNGYNYIEDMVCDSSGKFWMSSIYGGFESYDPATNELRIIRPALQGDDREENTILSLQLNEDNTIWCTSSGGLELFNPSTSKFSSPAFKPEGKTETAQLISHLLLRDHKNNIWLINGNKLVEVDPKRGTYAVKVDDKKTISSTSHGVAESPDGSIWFTDGDQLFYRGSTETDFYKVNCDVVKSTMHNLVSDDKNNLLIGTQTGLIKYIKATRQFTLYSTADGLYENKLQEGFDKGKNGELFLHGAGYITIINPSKLNKEYLPAPLVIESMNIGTNDTFFDFANYKQQRLQLNYQQNQFGVTFRLLQFDNANQVTYSYKLDGWDKNWISVGSGNHLAYSNLKGGDYTLHIKAFNADGNENPGQATFMFHIDSPFWQTRWFMFTIILLIFGIIYFIYNIRLQRMLAVQKIRLQISRDLHDEIGASLSSVHIMSKFAEDTADNSTSETKQWLHRIGENSKEMMEKIRDIVWTLNSTGGSSVGTGNLIGRMNQFISQVLEPKDITVNFSADEKVEELLKDFMTKRNVYLIFKEAVNNIAKYAACSEVDIVLTINKNRVLLRVKDNGIGFDITGISKGNGLANMHQRAGQIHAELDVQSSVGGGTVIELKLPIPQMRYWFTKRPN